MSNTCLSLDYAEQILNEIFEEPEECNYTGQKARIRKSLLKLLGQYETLGASTRAFLDKLLSQHKEYCLKMHNSSWVRQHNSFVLYYIKGMSGRRVAFEQSIQHRTVYKDIDAVLDRMLIFLLGFYGIRWDK